MLSVVCLNTGNYLGRGEEYVRNLRRMVARNLTVPHEFVCLTEADISAKGWWGKLELVQRRWGGWVLYLDLDIVIRGNIDRLIEVAQSDAGRVWMRDDFSYSILNPCAGLGPDMLKLLGGPGCCNSSVMVFHDTVDLSGMTDEMCSTMHGDQNVLSALLWPDRIGLLPADMISSYKYHVLRGEPAGSVVVFHGVPKVTDLWAGDPLRMTWEGRDEGNDSLRDADTVAGQAGQLLCARLPEGRNTL